MRQFVAHNRMLAGRLRDRGPPRHARRHRPARSCASSARSTRSRPPPAVRAIAARRAARRGLRGRAARRALRPRRRLGGRRATTWPTVADWARWRDGRGRAARAASEPVDEDEPTSPTRRASTRARRTALELAAGVGRRRRARRSAAPPSRDRAAARASSPREVDRPAAAAGPARSRSQPRHADLARPAARRAGRARARTTSSSCSRTAPTRTPRSRTRIDNVVRGLLSLGVRQGEHVGVLMEHPPERARGRRRAQPARRGRGAAAPRRRPSRARPSSAASTRIVADPEHAERGRGGRRGRRCSCSAAAARTRDLGARRDRHGAHRPRRGRAAGLVPAQPGPRARPRVHPLHRRGRAHARQPDHQRPLGAVGVRHRVVGGAARRPTPSTASRPLYHPSGAADEHRRRDRRRRAARDRAATSTRRPSGTRCAATA